MTIGLLLGLAGALAGTHLVESFLYGVRPNDPSAFAGAGVLLVAVTRLPNYVPARVATS